MLKKLILYLLFVYKKCISPLLGHRCRFVPTCSEYCRDAINSYGVCKGLALAA